MHQSPKSARELVMAFLTIFTCPTHRRERLAIEANAQRSWRRLIPAPAVRWVQMGTLRTDEYGTPLVSSVLAEGEALATSDLVAYVNTDILLLQNWMRAVKAVAQAFPDLFLMIGQRYDLNVTQKLSFETGWQHRLEAKVKTQGVLHQDAGIDYFVYRPGLWRDIPPFALGRWSWDNWLVWKALAQGVPVIDATAVATAVHQNHDGRHRGHHAEQQRQRNADLVTASGGRLCRIRDATHVLTAKYKIVKRNGS